MGIKINNKAGRNLNGKFEQKLLMNFDFAFNNLKRLKAHAKVICDFCHIWSIFNILKKFKFSILNLITPYVFIDFPHNAIATCGVHKEEKKS